MLCFIWIFFFLVENKIYTWLIQCVMVSYIILKQHFESLVNLSSLDFLMWKIIVPTSLGFWGLDEIIPAKFWAQCLAQGKCLMLFFILLRALHLSSGITNSIKSLSSISSILHRTILDPQWALHLIVERTLWLNTNVHIKLFTCILKLLVSFSVENWGSSSNHKFSYGYTFKIKTGFLTSFFLFASRCGKFSLKFVWFPIFSTMKEHW